jgi:anti-anti-sigma factor
VLQDRSAPYVAVDVNRDLGIVTITLRGELDITARSALSEHLTEHLAEYLAQLASTQPEQLVFGMTGVDFLDRAAAAAIFTAARLLLPIDVKPVMRSPRRPVRRLLEMTGLDQQCELDPDGRRPTRRVSVPLPRQGPGKVI